MAAEADLVDLISRIKSTSSSVESYFHPSKQLPQDIIESLKSLFDFSRQKNDVKEDDGCVLSELMVEGFDDEQIWQQIELQNVPVVSGSRKQLKNIKGLQDNLKLLPENVEYDSDTHSDDESDIEFDDDNLSGDADQMEACKELIPASSSDDDDDDTITKIENNNNGIIQDSKKKVESSKQNNQSINLNGKQKHKNARGSVVDDRFFKLSEMTDFLDKMDQQFERIRDGKMNNNDDNDDDDDEEEEVDFFRDFSSEEEDDDDGDDWGNVLGNTANMVGRDVKQSKPKAVGELKYGDYFDPPEQHGRQKNKEIEGDDNGFEDDLDEEDENEDMESDEDERMEDDEEDEDQSELMEEDEEHVTDDDQLENDDDNSLSRHEENQAKMKKKITQLEKENLTKKPWQMSGEAGSTARPVNSLLEEDLNFDHTTAVAPPITEETTKELEDIIKQRIKDEAWDDVERKQKPVAQPFEYKKKLPLDQEKSKLSLSQIYEQEYIKQTETKETTEEEKESEEHKEIKELMKTLFTKLDALSNFHFTPKPLKPEVKIVTNVPAINMEEVAPVAVSDAMLLAPEETKEKEVELKGDTEKTETDRKRERRSKKLRQRMKAKEKEKKSKLVSKLNPGLGNKYAKKKALERIEKESKTSKNLSVIKEDAGEKALKSSSAFFSRLHDEVKQQVNSKKVTSEKRKSKTSTSKLKL